jgi:hypothetical protein
MNTKAAINGCPPGHIFGLGIPLIAPQRATPYAQGPQTSGPLTRGGLGQEKVASDQGMVLGQGPILALKTTKPPGQLASDRPLVLGLGAVLGHREGRCKPPPSTGSGPRSYGLVKAGQEGGGAILGLGQHGRHKVVLKLLDQPQGYVSKNG